MQRSDTPTSASLVRSPSLGTSSALVDAGIGDLDARRRLLERRIEATKERLVADLGRAKEIMVRAKARAERGLVRVAMVAGALLLLGLMTAFVRRRKRRIRVTWR